MQLFRLAVASFLCVSLAVHAEETTAAPAAAPAPTTPVDAAAKVPAEPPAAAPLSDVKSADDANADDANADDANAADPAPASQDAPPSGVPPPSAPPLPLDPTTPTSTGPESATSPDGVAERLDVEEEDAPQPLPFHITAALNQSVGSGTFVIDHSHDPLVSTSLFVVPSMQLGDFTLSLTEIVNIEWTQSNSTTYNLQPLWSDAVFNTAYSGFRLDDLGMRFRVNAGYAAPISLTSIHAGSIGTLLAGASTTWSQKDWGLSVRGGLDGSYRISIPALAALYANDKGSTYDDRTAGSVQPAGCLLRSADEAAAYGCGSIPGGARWSALVGTSYTFFQEELSLSLDLGVSQSIAAFASPIDELSSPRARSGAHHIEQTSGTLAISYSPLEWFSVSGGVQSYQPMFTDDGKLLRMPFFDVISPAANNYWAFFVSASFSYGGGPQARPGARGSQQLSGGSAAN